MLHRTKRYVPASRLCRTAVPIFQKYFFCQMMGAVRKLRGRGAVFPSRGDGRRRKRLISCGIFCASCPDLGRYFFFHFSEFLQKAGNQRKCQKKRRKTALISPFRVAIFKTAVYTFLKNAERIFCSMPVHFPHPEGSCCAALPVTQDIEIGPRLKFAGIHSRRDFFAPERRVFL